MSDTQVQSMGDSIRNFIDSIVEFCKRYMGGMF